MFRISFGPCEALFRRTGPDEAANPNRRYDLCAGTLVYTTTTTLLTAAASARLALLSAA